MERKSTYSFRLDEIANWILKKTDNKGKPHAEIPSFQRQLVWNPSQIEVLWDSLMRGIPIGVFSLLSANDTPKYGNSVKDDQTFWLLDGLQRANAISLGYQSFPGNQKEESILWIDLLPDNEQKKRSNRKYFFYLTTIAQPWGYKINDANGENRSEKLSASERRVALNTLKIEDATDQSTLIFKPSTGQLFPVKANCPIPFALFREYYEKIQDYYEDQKDWLLAIVKQHEELNPSLSLRLQDSISSRWDEVKVTLKELRCGMKIADKTTVTALVAPNEISQSSQDVGKSEDDVQRDSDIAVYFARLNHGGTIPSNEELNYSILKSITPSLANIDKIAEKKMHPARLANIAMLCYSSLHERKWINQIYRRTVYSLAGDDKFTHFACADIGGALKELHSLLSYDKENNSLGIPPVILSSIAKNNQSFYQLLIMIVCMRGFKNVSSWILIGFTTLVTWFGNGVDFAKMYQDCLQNPEMDFEKIAKHWLFEMVQKGKLFLPPTLCVYDAICDAVDPNNMYPLEKIYTAWNPTGYDAGTNRVWYWNQREAREMLLYVCRDYMAEFFGSYDPDSVIWNGDCCPWDYDHIFPQNWIVSGSGRRQGKKYHELVDTFFNCIGNISPLHFSLNRGKNCSAPGDYFKLKEKLFITCDDTFFNTVPDPPIEYDETGKLPYQYVSVIAQRLRCLYKKWYIDDLKIGALLDFSSMEDMRRTFFGSLESSIKGARSYYVLSNGKQAVISAEQTDYKTVWARPWISCGVEMEVQSTADVKLRSKCLVCIASNGTLYEIGLRRHPNDDKVYGNGGRWWFDRDYMSTEIEKTLERFRSLARANNIELIEKYY